MKRNRKEYDPLSIPTNQPYYIDSNALVGRVIENQNSNQTIDEHDLIQAIARLDLRSKVDEQKIGRNLAAEPVVIKSGFFEFKDSTADQIHDVISKVR